MEYRIGEFSLRVRLPVKTLHFYHQEGLLLPCRVDAVSGYRWYGEAEVQRASLIGLFKSAGFTLGEIKAILAECREDEDLGRFLDRKLVQIDQRIRELKTTGRELRHLRARLGDGLPEGGTGLAVAALPAGNTAHSGDTPPGVRDSTSGSLVREVELPPLVCLSIRFTGRYDEVGPRFGLLMSQARSLIAGPPFCLYHHMEYEEENADIEACLPLREAASHLDCKTLPARTCLETLHVGPYTRLGDAYQRLFDHAASRGLEPCLPIQETYLKGPGRFFPGRPENWRTLVRIPVEPRDGR